MIEIHKSTRDDAVIGAWVYDDTDACLFIPNNDIKKTLEFIDKIGTLSPGYSEINLCTNCALTFTNQFMISDCSEDIVLELDELTQFVSDLQAIL